MKAARLYTLKDALKLEDIPIPTIEKEDEVVIKVKAAGMCYSDIHVIDGVIPTNLPLTLGHEIAGEVHEAGTNSGFSKGEKVLVHFMNPCGKCKYCLEGKGMQCINQFTRPEYGFSADGGYAEYCKVDADRLVRIPDDLAIDFAATLGCAGITAYHAVKSIADTELADTIAVYGTGGVGLYTLQIAKASGAKTIAISRSDDKLRLAEELGADYTVNANNIKEVKKITDGLGADIIFDFVVNEQSIANSQKIIANGGKIVLVGVSNKPISINPQLFVLKELSVLGSLVGTKNELEELVWLASSNRIKSIVSKHYSLDQINDGLKELREGKIVGRGCINL
ncbi:MAG: NAD(P)-dependent alcohol dehydrogenase [Candidatus Nitrosocaldaceae archaeon]|nr:MAG: NAD(P)-dependent alcohol dehydrogenase [Candidatus Nitrosocaldaceae archaeon]